MNLRGTGIHQTSPARLQRDRTALGRAHVQFAIRKQHVEEIESELFARAS